MAVGVAAADGEMHGAAVDAEAQGAVADDVAVPPMYGAVVEALATAGFAVVRHALPATLVARLRARALVREATGAMVPAAVGRGPARQHHDAIRGDRIGWLEAADTDAAERAVLVHFDALRRACNEALQLGLFEFEAHYALYPPGAAYAAHRDRFRDDDARVLSCVLYLNEGWMPAHGGALRLHVDAAGTTYDVLPEGGTLVAFLSERFVHEVLPATRPRLALTGWFRRRMA